MALTGLQIQKLLPKTNCKECGSNTCLAFAMKLAAKKAELSECPYVSEEAVAILGAASEPPVKTVNFGMQAEVVSDGENVTRNIIPAKIGGETVLYRHEKTFYNQPILAININDDDDSYMATLENIKNYLLERVGELLILGAVAVTQKLPASDKFLNLVAKAKEVTGLPLIVRSADAAAVAEAAKVLKGTNSLIAGVTDGNAAAMKALAEENELNLAVTGETIDEIAALTAKIKEDGFNNLVIEFKTETLSDAFQFNSICRRAAIKNNVKAVGYASLKFIDTGDMMSDTVAAVTEINKYGGICVLPAFEPAQLMCLMTLRQNIYTDPQKPIQVEPKIYEVGEPDKNSPVFVTTNFSLTYFLVSGEIENSGISAWLVIPDCEGFSVLTAWSAGKFSGAHIAKAVKEFGLEDMTDTRTITIPGYVSQISGELEENLPGWKVLVGPQESSDIESFVKAVLMKQ